MTDPSTAEALEVKTIHTLLVIDFKSGYGFWLPLSEEPKLTAPVPPSPKQKPHKIKNSSEIVTEIQVPPPCPVAKPTNKHCAVQGNG